MFTWASTRWVASWVRLWAESEKRSSRLAPIKAMPARATAVKDRDSSSWMLILR